jgi:hypothetical protein
MLEKQLSDVEQFHLKVTGLPMPDVPTLLTGDRFNKRDQFLEEELEEFENATTS